MENSQAKGPTSIKLQIIAFVSVFVILPILAVVGPRAYGIFDFFSSTNGFFDVFYGQLGLDSRLSKFLSVPAAFFSVVASAYVYSWSLIKLLSGFGSLREFGIGLIACTITFSLPQAITFTGEKIAGESCFVQGSGNPQKWYVIDKTGRIIMSDTGGIDDRGRKKRAVTTEICEIFFDQKEGRFPRPIAYIPGQTKLFDSLTGRPIAWYKIQSDGTILLFDYPGFDVSTRKFLTPVDPSIEAKLDYQVRKAGTMATKNASAAWAIGITRYSQEQPFLNRRASKFLLDRISACWTGPATLSTTFSSLGLIFFLNENGTPSGFREVSQARNAREVDVLRAMQGAIQDCAPYAGLPTAEYSAWRALVLNASIVEYPQLQAGNMSGIGPIYLLDNRPTSTEQE